MDTNHLSIPDHDRDDQVEEPHEFDEDFEEDEGNDEI